MPTKNKTSTTNEPTQPSAQFVPFEQRKRRIFLCLSAPVLAALVLFTEPYLSQAMLVPQILQQVGILCLFACILGRCWSILYIGKNKNKKLVQNGPYRFTRNPLYFASAVGMMSFGFLLDSFVIGIILFLFTYFSFNYVIKKEALTLRNNFGDEFETYANIVPEFFPRLTTLVPPPKETEFIEFSPHALSTTLGDASWFLLLLPASHIILWLHEAHYLPAFFKLY